MLAKFIFADDQHKVLLQHLVPQALQERKKQLKEKSSDSTNSKPEIAPKPRAPRKPPRTKRNQAATKIEDMPFSADNSKEVTGCEPVKPDSNQLPDCLIDLSDLDITATGTPPPPTVVSELRQNSLNTLSNPFDDIMDAVTSSEVKTNVLKPTLVDDHLNENQVLTNHELIFEPASNFTKSNFNANVSNVAPFPERTSLSSNCNKKTTVSNLNEPHNQPFKTKSSNVQIESSSQTGNVENANSSFLSPTDNIEHTRPGSLRLTPSAPLLSSLRSKVDDVSKLSPEQFLKVDNSETETVGSVGN